jgi:hypothetical protein
MNCYLHAFFYRKAGKHGVRKAIVATAHRLLLIAFCILRDGTQYRDPGDNYFDQLPSGTYALSAGQKAGTDGLEVALSGGK